MLAIMRRAPPGDALAWSDGNHTFGDNLLKMPADPTPATERPMIRVTLLGAAPQMALPISKMASAVLRQSSAAG